MEEKISCFAEKPRSICGILVYNAYYVYYAYNACIIGNRVKVPFFIRIGQRPFNWNYPKIILYYWISLLSFAFRLCMTIVCKFQQVPLVAKGFPRGFLTIYREPRIPLKPTLNVSRTPKNKDKVQLYLEWESESILYLEWGEHELEYI